MISISHGHLIQVVEGLLLQLVQGLMMRGVVDGGMKILHGVLVPLAGLFEILFAIFDLAVVVDLELLDPLFQKLLLPS